jgi:hypothetical protein
MPSHNLTHLYDNGGCQLQTLEELDDEGNIMASTDKPNNTTNSHVGLDNTWDLDKVYKSNIPKSMRYYSGYFGTGIVTW